MENEIIAKNILGPGAMKRNVLACKIASLPAGKALGF